jgi:hypothetical protein
VLNCAISFGAATKVVVVTLRSELFILVDPTTSKKAAMYHALEEKKNRRLLGR